MPRLKNWKHKAILYDDYTEKGKNVRFRRERRNARIGVCRSCGRTIVPNGDGTCPICHTMVERMTNGSTRGSG